MNHWVPPKVALAALAAVLAFSWISEWQTSFVPSGGSNKKMGGSSLEDPEKWCGLVSKHVVKGNIGLHNNH